MNKERRLVGLFIDQEALLGWMRGAVGAAEFLMLPTLSCIPDGCAVVGVGYVIERQGFLFVLQHPTFEHVPEGSDIPILNGMPQLQAAPFFVICRSDEENAPDRLVAQIEMHVRQLAAVFKDRVGRRQAPAQTIEVEAARETTEGTA